MTTTQEEEKICPIAHASIKSKVLDRGIHIKNLQNKMNKMLILSSKQMIKLGTDAIKEFRIEMGGYDKAYRKTEIKDYTNKKGHTSKAHYMGSQYMGTASKRSKLGENPAWIIVSIEITADTFDVDFEIDENTGLLKPRPRR
jgi:hypothetical protein